MAPDSKSFLRQIHPLEGDAENAEIDLVAVHGLDPLNRPGHAYSTWTHKQHKYDLNGKLWLRDFLPTHPRMPKLRVLLFGYNSSAALKASTVGVAGAASNLLDQLRFKRLGHEERPIVFVCHSLGGLVVKQALVEAHNADEIHGATLKATKGIAFFGTPHRGGHGAQLGDNIVRVLQALTGNVRNDIMENLRKDSFLSNHLQLNFARRARHMRVVNFIETQPISDLPVLKHFGLVVPRTSSALGWREPDEVQVLMEASHTTICKFASETDELYLRVADHLLELLTWITQPVPVESLPLIVIQPTEATERTEFEPPPSYASLTEITDIKHQGKSFSGSSAESDSSDGDEISGGWLNRIRAASPFRAASPRPVMRSRKASLDEPVPVEPVQITWPIVMLPYPQNDSYINRSEIWQQIVSVMNQGIPIVLHGVGGAGKTQTTIHLIYWFRERNPDASIMWVNASSWETCLTGLQLIASRAGMQTTNDRTSRLTALKEYLEHSKSGRWIMVFDSADDVTVYQAVSEFIPHCIHGQVIVTSRRRLPTTNSRAPEFVLELNTLNPNEAVDLVRSSLRPDLLANVDDADMNRLLRELNFLPLAIAQAVAFMNKNSVSVTFYRSKISDPTMLSEQLSRNHITENYTSGASPPVYSAWRTSFERLRVETPHAGKLLGYLSFLEATMIPMELVQAFGHDGGDIDGAVEQLEEYSFAELNKDRTRLSLHRLVQLTTQRWLEETSQVAKSQQHVLSTLAQHFPDPEIVDNWPHCEAWLPHAVKVLGLVEGGVDENKLAGPSTSVTSLGSTDSNSGQLDLPLIATLKMKAGFYCYQVGEYATAQEYLEEAADSSRRVLGTMHDLTLKSQEKLIYILRYLDHYRQAATYARDLKRARKAKLGPEHRDTIESYRIYSLTLQDLSKWKDALDASEKALAGYKELHKNDLSHREILRSQRRTATCSAALGQYQKAETLLNEAIQGYKERSGSDTAVLIDCVYALARLQGDMGSFVESEKNARKAYEMRQSFMKKSHPDVLKAYWAIGLALCGQKQWEPAQEIFERLLVEAETRPGFGKTHNYAYILRYSLATLKEGWAKDDENMLGAGAGYQKFCEAKVMLEDVFQGRKIALGEDHLDTLVTKATLASVNGKLGRFHDSEKASQEVLKLVTSRPYQRLGVASAKIAWICLASLGQCAIDRATELQGRPGAAIQVKEQYRLACTHTKAVVDGMEKMLGAKQALTIAAAVKYAEALELAGDNKAAERVRQRFEIKWV